MALALRCSPHKKLGHKGRAGDGDSRHLRLSLGWIRVCLREGRAVRLAAAIPPINHSVGSEKRRRRVGSFWAGDTYSRPGFLQRLFSSQTRERAKLFKGLHRVSHLRRISATGLAIGAAPLVEKDTDFLGDDMTLNPQVTLTGGRLAAHGHTILTDVPDNIVVTPDEGPDGVKGAFIGGRGSEAASSHFLKLGQLRGLRFLSCFRFKLWWMTQRVGDRASQIPMETQFLLLESNSGLSPESSKACGGDTDVTYIVMLPLLDGSFRASLRGGANDELMLCIESGDPAVTATESLHAIYLNAGPDPYTVTSEAVRAVEHHTQSFMRRERKQLPGILDYFGWCTWDAFYTDVSVDGVHEGLTSFAAGGTPAKFLIIDDGWQSVAADGIVSEDMTLTAGTQYASRLTDIKENGKFKQRAGHVPGDAVVDLGHVVQDMKADHDLKYVYVWHALMGYWGGVQLGKGNMEQYDSALIYPVHSTGILENQPDMASDSLTINGLGVVHPEKIRDFYDELHGYLAQQGVDGVKVDVQSILETLGAGYGGRVKLAKVYHEALEASIAKHFPDNGIISCMSHHTDGIYSSKQTAVVRASDDFWPRDPASHTTHIASVAYNSMFLGEFMQPDWDMFHSLHAAADYHGAARAVGGCAVYVSDKPGEHDFALLRKLVLPDGTVLRAQLPGRPTRDSLFVDPGRDKRSALKIWNLNLFGGVVGAFNCQGAGWCNVDKKYAIHDESPDAVQGAVRAMDVDALATLADASWNGEAAMYSHRGGELKRLAKGAGVPFTLGQLQYEVFTIVPIKILAPGVEFAPVGLIEMFNSGGAILSLSYHEAQADAIAQVQMGVRGCGEFGAYSSVKPRTCTVDSRIVDFAYNSLDGRVVIGLEHRSGHVWSVGVEF